MLCAIEHQEDEINRVCVVQEFVDMFEPVTRLSSRRAIKF